MPLPVNRVDTVRVPNDTTTYNIVPSSLRDGSGKHSIATPTTTKDTTLVVGVKINNVMKEQTNGIVNLGTFQDGLDGDQLAAEKEKRAPRKQLYYIYGMTCILAHHTFGFTDDEKKTLNLLHDGGGDSRVEIIKWCESQLRALGY